MIRSIGYLTIFLIASSPVWAGELDAEYGAKTPSQPPAIALASVTTVPNHGDEPSMIGKGSELDTERSTQAWRRFGGFGGWGRGIGWGGGWGRGIGWGGGWGRGIGWGGGWGRGIGWGGGWGRGIGWGGGLGWGGGWGGGLGWGGGWGGGLGWGGGWGYSYLPVTYYSTASLGFGGYGLGCW